MFELREMLDDPMSNEGDLLFVSESFEEARAEGARVISAWRAGLVASDAAAEQRRLVIINRSAETVCKHCGR
jgi:hypothetical protein